jgi:hypothetical protein
MLIALVFGTVGAMMLCAVIWRGGSGRLWTFMGMLTLLAAGEFDWYALTHGWQTTHRHIGPLLIPAAIVGLACLSVGRVQSRRA